MAWDIVDEYELLSGAVLAAIDILKDGSSSEQRRVKDALHELTSAVEVLAES
jgi:hypothetical protein